ncbi:uncharacterized protein N7515_002466 [Penicillium bovifimosum]|uniref:BZIP domain-containing protein n=1 Tax=Penicillium bovifimosum TaxID=126998 RepID=A0A9W9HBR0_9EURO|nr:uncharacterized protein N7515_002466 [Penicillium bovifimosum]KAJ5143679.1 hypothetical protein N7515_002466 [Penicillium bovifimosum]
MDMLSSRSYLELLPEGQDTAETLITTPVSSELSPEIKNEPERQLRPRKKRTASKAPEIPAQMAEGTNATAADRPVRKRGRPRLETTKDATAIEERRLQIRRAQRTYRLKKEFTIQTLRSRVDTLEKALDNVTGILSATHRDAADTLTSDSTQPSIDYLARTRELILAEIDKTRFTDEDGTDPQSEHVPGPSKAAFGYQVSHARNTARPQKKNRNSSSTYRASNRARSPSPLINRLLPAATIYTYSHQESCLARRLHRFCLEHTYRWLTDARTEPAFLGRVFGLVPCIHDMPGIRRHYRKTLQSEIGSTLEFSKMPFYTLGGAGKHFPRVSPEGTPVYPQNIRRPGKILRRMVRILQRGGIQDWDEDWSGDREPASPEQSQVHMSQEDITRSLDLDGEWFDCHDVQGYLLHRGLVLEGSALRLGVPESLVRDLYGVSPGRSTVSSMYASSEATYVDMTGSESTISEYTLDVECFFDLLLANLRILGRAPGFRVWDVDTALRAAISRRPFG